MNRRLLSAFLPLLIGGIGLLAQAGAAPAPPKPPKPPRPAKPNHQAALLQAARNAARQHALTNSTAQSAFQLQQQAARQQVIRQAQLGENRGVAFDEDATRRPFVGRAIQATGPVAAPVITPGESIHFTLPPELPPPR